MSDPNGGELCTFGKITERRLAREAELMGTYEKNKERRLAREAEAKQRWEAEAQAKEANKANPQGTDAVNHDLGGKFERCIPRWLSLRCTVLHLLRIRGYFVFLPHQTDQGGFTLTNLKVRFPKYEALHIDLITLSTFYTASRRANNSVKSSTKSPPPSITQRYSCSSSKVV